MLPLLLSLCLLQDPPPKETVRIPGTKVSFELVALPGDGKLRPFAIGAREVSWAELRLYSETEPKGVDAVTQAARVIRAFRQYGASEPDLTKTERAIQRTRLSELG